MAYRLKTGKVTAAGVRKIAREQTARAIEALSKDNVTPADVHEGRKAVKRVRSLLKLIEPALEPDKYAKSYKGIGRAGDLLAGARDRHVMQQTIAQLQALYGKEAAPATAFLMKVVEGQSGAEQPHIDEATLKRAKAAFAAQAAKLDKLRIKGKGLAVFAKGLEETYATARKNFAAAYRNPSDARFHEMRKAVQWHWRHMSLLSRAWPDYFAVRIAASQELADGLGEDHDLSVLLQAAAAKADEDASGFAAAQSLIKRRQHELRATAYALAERLLAERPKAFRSRMEAYWTAQKRLPPRADAPPNLDDA